MSKLVAEFWSLKKLCRVFHSALWWHTGYLNLTPYDKWQPNCKYQDGSILANCAVIWWSSSAADAAQPWLGPSHVFLQLSALDNKQFTVVSLLAPAVDDSDRPFYHCKNLVNLLPWLLTACLYCLFILSTSNTCTSSVFCQIFMCRVWGLSMQRGQG